MQNNLQGKLKFVNIAPFYKDPILKDVLAV
jgi:hypothetical protein